MSALDRRDDSLDSGEILECIDRLIIGNCHILGPSCIVKICVFRSDSRIVKTCGDGIYRGDLSVLILTEVGLHAVENSETSCRDGRRCLCCVHAASCCLAADKLNVLILDEVVECADSVGSAADTGENCVRKTSLFL